jgi:hypothetical protein
MLRGQVFISKGWVGFPAAHGVNPESGHRDQEIAGKPTFSEDMTSTSMPHGAEA